MGNVPSRDGGVQRAFFTSAHTQRDAGSDAHLEDPVLAAPIPLEALVHAGKTDDAVARALLKKNPVIEAARMEVRAEGKAEGKAEAVVAILVARGMNLDAAEGTRIAAERDPNRLDRWIAAAVAGGDVARILGTT
jgi:hypothetical protein